MRAPKASEVVAHQLVNYIAENRLPDGARLPNERELGEIFSVGRSTLREALRLLETRGVITILKGPNGGPVVREPQPADLGEALALILQLRRSTLREVVEARRAIDPAIARLAVARVTIDELEELEKSVAKMFTLIDDAEAFIIEAAQFRRRLAAMARNAALESFYASLVRISDDVIFRTQHAPDQLRIAAEDYRDVVAAIRASDPTATEAAMRKHLDDWTAHWLQEYGPLLDTEVQWSLTPSIV